MHKSAQNPKSLDQRLRSLCTEVLALVIVEIQRCVRRLVSEEEINFAALESTLQSIMSLEHVTAKSVKILVTIKMFYLDQYASN